MSARSPELQLSLRRSWHLINFTLQGFPDSLNSMLNSSRLISARVLRASVVADLSVLKVMLNDRSCLLIRASLIPCIRMSMWTVNVHTAKTWKTLDGCPWIIVPFWPWCSMRWLARLSAEYGLDLYEIYFGRCKYVAVSGSLGSAILQNTHACIHIMRRAEVSCGDTCDTVEVSLTYRNDLIPTSEQVPWNALAVANSGCKVMTLGNAKDMLACSHLLHASR